MAKYVLVLHEEPGKFGELSPQEIQGIIEKYRSWSLRMAESGHLLSGEKLRDNSGRNLRKGGQGIVVDGPFSETKEVIGGFFMIEADDYDSAVSLCGDCPHLEYGRIEIREVEPTS